MKRFAALRTTRRPAVAESWVYSTSQVIALEIARKANLPLTFVSVRGAHYPRDLKVHVFAPPELVVLCLASIWVSGFIAGFVASRKAFRECL